MSLQRTFYFFDSPAYDSRNNALVIGADGSGSSTIADLDSKITEIQKEIKSLEAKNASARTGITSNTSTLSKWQSDLDKKPAECAKVSGKKNKARCQNDWNYKKERVASYKGIIANLNSEIVANNAQIELKKNAIKTLQKSIDSINESRQTLASKGLTPEVLQTQADAEARAIKAKAEGEVKNLQEQSAKIADAQAKSIASQSGAKKWILIGVGTAIIVLITIIIIQKIRSNKKKAKAATTA